MMMRNDVDKDIVNKNVMHFRWKNILVIIVVNCFSSVFTFPALFAEFAFACALAWISK